MGEGYEDLAAQRTSRSWMGVQRHTSTGVISVKAGANIGVAMIRDLRAVMERDGCTFGLFLSAYEPTGPMKAEAAGRGVCGEAGCGVWRVTPIQGPLVRFAHKLPYPSPIEGEGAGALTVPLDGGRIRRLGRAAD